MRRRHLRLGLFVIGLFIAGLPVDALADDPHNLSIHVSIAGTKTLSVNTTHYNFGDLATSASSVTATSIQVENTSGVFIETYTVTGADAISDLGGAPWTIGPAPGVDVYSLAAQFSDTRPADNDGSWTNDTLDTNATTCSATVLGNGTEDEGGSNVSPGGIRELWFRIKMPTSVASGGPHTITAVLAVY